MLVACFLRGGALAYDDDHNHRDDRYDPNAVDSISAPAPRRGGAVGGAAPPQPVLRSYDTPGGVWRSNRAASDASWWTNLQAKPPLKKEISIDEARVIFVAVINKYFMLNSPDGYWHYTDPDTKKSLELKLLEINKSSVQLLEDTLYSGQVALRENGADKKISFSFTVDISSDRWDVLDFRRSAENAGIKSPENISLAEQRGLAIARNSFDATVRKHLMKARGDGNSYEIIDPILRKTWRLRFTALRLESIRGQPDGTVTGCLEFDDLFSSAKLDVDFFTAKTQGGWIVKNSFIHRIQENP